MKSQKSLPLNNPSFKGGDSSSANGGHSAVPEKTNSSANPLFKRWGYASSLPFTFLELFICLTIVCLLGSLLGWQAKKSVDIQRFQHSAHRLACELRHLQILALTYQADVTLTLYWKSGELLYSIASDEPIPIIELTRACKLGGIEKVTIEQGKPMRKELTLTILSSGRIVKEGTIELHQGARSIILDLSTPLQIQQKRIG